MSRALWEDIWEQERGSITVDSRPFKTIVRSDEVAGGGYRVTFIEGRALWIEFLGVITPQVVENIIKCSYALLKELNFPKKRVALLCSIDKTRNFSKRSRTLFFDFIQSFGERSSVVFIGNSDWWRSFFSFNNRGVLLFFEKSIESALICVDGLISLQDRLYSSGDSSLVYRSKDGSYEIVIGSNNLSGVHIVHRGTLCEADLYEIERLERLLMSRGGPFVINIISLKIASLSLLKRVTVDFLAGSDKRFILTIHPVWKLYLYFTIAVGGYKNISVKTSVKSVFNHFVDEGLESDAPISVSRESISTLLSFLRGAQFDKPPHNFDLLSPDDPLYDIFVSSYFNISDTAEIYRREEALREDCASLKDLVRLEQARLDEYLDRLRLLEEEKSRLRKGLSELSDRSRELIDRGASEDCLDIDVRSILEGVVDLSNNTKNSEYFTKNEKVFSVRELLSNIQVEELDRCNKKGLFLNIYTDGRVPDFVVGDPFKLQQALQIVVANSIENTAEGTISIKCHSHLAEGAFVNLHFSISHTADDEFISRSKNFASHSEENGLSRAVRVINFLGGDIKIYEVDRVGITFKIAISFKTVGGEEFTKNRVNSLSNKRIFILSSSSFMVGRLKNILYKDGARVTVYSDLRQLENSIFSDGFQSPDLCIISDNFGLYDSTALLNIVENRLRSPILEIGGDIGSSQIKADRVTSIMEPFDDSDIVLASLSLIQSTPQAVEVVEERKTANCIKILIVEDNLINQKITSAILTKMGYFSEVADDGEIALDMVKNERYDAILMDCHMPRMDGYEATRSIRLISDSKTDPSVPIIAVTANIEEGQREVCLESGMDDYLPKPVDPDKLKVLLKKWIGGE